MIQTISGDSSNVMDFTLHKYEELIHSLQAYGFESLTLRHDVDALPGNSLRTAQIEAAMGMKGIYYFRAVPESWDEDVIREISSLGHEIGYHYESLTTCNGDVNAAYEDFCRNLELLRKLASVRNICMHGSPRSPWDSRDIWKKYEYRALGIENEPYLDTDFSKTFYLTDTGRCWDGWKASVRDKIPRYQDNWVAQGLVFHTTDDLLDGLRRDIVPRDLMITVHPQRWNPFGLRWCREALLQPVKNGIKRIIIEKR